MFACPQKSRNGWSWRRRLGRMVGGSWKRSTKRAACPGYGNWMPSKHCGGCGCSTLMPMNSRRASRADAERPPGAQLITSPYDIEARYSRKRSTAWTGYKVHFTQMGEDDEPHFIVEVVSTHASTPVSRFARLIATAKSAAAV